MLKPYLLLLLTVTVTVAAGVSRVESAEEISQSPGGLIVHVGCGDGRVTADFYQKDRCRVQGLDRKQSNVQLARDHFRSRGLSGKVSARQYDGEHLPYVDNLVNYIFVSPSETRRRAPVWPCRQSVPAPTRKNRHHCAARPAFPPAAPDRSRSRRWVPG